MLYIVILIGILFIILERLIPDQKLPEVKGWWFRVFIINCFQLGIIFVGNYTWDKWLQGYKILNLQASLSPFSGGIISYFIITFIFYWWHRWRHDIDFLWRGFHQVHHSPQRIETITSFYKHPLEIVADSILVGFINYQLLGIGIEGAGWTLLFTAAAEYFYHMNIKTPYWIGYFFQRPEMHRIHHERGKHYKNFSDLPVWDMLFGTYENPRSSYRLCGFKPERETRLLQMIFFQNVNNKSRKKDIYET